MKLSITKAADLAGVSRTTLYNDMNSGKLTFEIDGKEKKAIDISELERVYGPLNSGMEQGAFSTVHTEQNFTQASDMNIHVQIAVLREKLQTLEFERSRERDQFSDEIEHLRERLEAAENERTKLTAVLTDQRENGEEYVAKQSEKVDSLEKTIAQMRLQNKRIVQELKNQRGQGLWKRLFSGS